MNLSVLTRTPATELFSLYSELEAPALDEMNGEYSATLLPQLHPLIELLGRWSIFNPLYPGYWFAKGFSPDGQEGGQDDSHAKDQRTGNGYNLFRHRNRIVTRWPMQTLIHPSRFDGKPAYQLVYPAYRSIVGRLNMIDEIRRIDEGLYLGFGTCGFGSRMRSLRLPFALQGPIANFRGIGNLQSSGRDAGSILGQLSLTTSDPL